LPGEIIKNGEISLQTEVTESVKTRQKNNSAVELKGSVFTLPILHIQVASIPEIEADLLKHLSKARKFFENAPVVIDLKSIAKVAQDFDFHGLMKLLSQQHLIPVGVKNGSNQQNALAVSAGLAILKGGISPPDVDEKTSIKEKPTPTTDNTVKDATPVVAGPDKTKVVTQPVRSGQQVYAKGGDLIILAPVNHGAEIIADGNIHIYSTMRGRALAGVRGDVNANIFCQSMEAELVAIAGNFRVFEEDMPAEIKSKSVRIHLDNEQLVITQI